MQPLHQIFFELLWFATCIYAVARGGAPERVIGIAVFAAVVATNIVPYLWRKTAHFYTGVEFGIAVVDTALFIVAVAVAITSTRFWPMLLASMLGCELLGHLARPLGPDIIPPAYYVMVAIWGYPTLLLLVAGTWRHGVRLRRYGVDYGWMQDLPHQYRDGWSVEESKPALDQS